MRKIFRSFRPLDTCRETALLNYGKFLNGGRKISLDGIKSRRLALIICILINCIEGMQFHFATASQHLRQGLNILDEWMETTPPNRRILPSLFPRGETIEDEIVLQLRSLELQNKALYEPMHKEAEEKLKLEGRDYLRRMPALFESVREARVYLELILKTVYRHAGLSSIDETVQYTESVTEEEYGVFATGLISAKAVGFERELYMSEVRRWIKAFEPLYRRTGPSHADFLSAKLLKLKSILLPIVLAGWLTRSQLIYDTFDSEFQEFTDLAASFFLHPDIDQILPQGAHSSSTGLLIPLFFTTTRCRSYFTRHRALSLMKSRCWREGDKWSIPMADMAKWMVAVEEDGRLSSSNYIPESARCRILAVEVKHERGPQLSSAKVRYVQGWGVEAVVRERQLGEWNMASELENRPASWGRRAFRPFL
jgi:hypothetical protein